MEDGSYKLSTFGEAAVITMRGVEESPNTKPRHTLSLPVKWKSIIGILMIGIVILASLSYLQLTSLNQLSLDYQQISKEYELLETEFEQVSADNERLLSWSLSPANVLAFLKNVVYLDMAKYYATLASNTVEYRSDLGGIVEEIFKYTLTYEGNKVDVTLRFRNNTLSHYNLHVLEGTPLYSQLQPTNILDAAKGLLERYHQYSGASHLEAIKNTLETVNENGDFVTTVGNVKLTISNEGKNMKIQFVHTSNNIDFQSKSVVLNFDNYGYLETLSDDWTIFNVGSTEVNVLKEEAINIAIEYANDFSWTVNGVEINNFTLIEDSISATLWPHAREDPLVLMPYWYITIFLDRDYPDRVNRFAVGLWADTGEVSIIQPLSW